MFFQVTAVVDGNTLDLAPSNWNWEGYKGSLVKPTGYEAPGAGGSAMRAKIQLERIVLLKQIELKNPVSVDRGRLVCDVYIHGKNLAEYLSEYKTAE